jgi:hypothetical protein
MEAAVYSIPSGSDRTVNWLAYFRLFPPAAVTRATGRGNSISKTLPQAKGAEAIIRFVHVVAKYSSRELASRTLALESVMNERPSFLKLGCLHPVACIRSGSGVSVKRNTVSIVVYYFIQIIRCMFRSYNHLQVEIYTYE